MHVRDVVVLQPTDTSDLAMSNVRVEGKACLCTTTPCVRCRMQVRRRSLADHPGHQRCTSLVRMYPENQEDSIRDHAMGSESKSGLGAPGNDDRREQGQDRAQGQDASTSTGNSRNTPCAHQTASNGQADMAESDNDNESAPVKVALAMLRFYKSILSPMMPSSCRFLPTCSEYSMTSYRQFGMWRGTVLTAWRLLRCNPWGGRGYDPPAWPPVGLGIVYDNFEYAPQVTVVLGSALAVYLVQGLLHELGL
eukprot:352421-Chlamydomonas_euryale.AAC.74